MLSGAQFTPSQFILYLSAHYRKLKDIELFADSIKSTKLSLALQKQCLKIVKILFLDKVKTVFWTRSEVCALDHEQNMLLLNTSDKQSSEFPSFWWFQRVLCMWSCSKAPKEWLWCPESLAKNHQQIFTMLQIHFFCALRWERERERVQYASHFLGSTHMMFFDELTWHNCVS